MSQNRTSFSSEKKLNFIWVDFFNFVTTNLLHERKSMIWGKYLGNLPENYVTIKRSFVLTDATKLMTIADGLDR